MLTWGIGLCAAALLVFSAQAMQAAQTACSVFASGVMPALFPMMVLCRLLPGTVSNERFKTIGRISTVLFGWAAGSPAAAQRLSRLGEKREALYALTGVMSPMFFAGTLAAWTGERRQAWLMLLLHWLGAALTALLWHVVTKQQCAASAAPAPRDSLPAAIRGAAENMLGVCGAMMLFSVAAGVARAALQHLFPVWTQQNARFLSAAWAVVEIGGGAHAVLEAWPDPPYALLSALCAFGGLSIWMQNLLFCPKSIRPAKLLWMRALHGAVCYGLARFIFS